MEVTNVQGQDKTEEKMRLAEIEAAVVAAIKNGTNYESLSDSVKVDIVKSINQIAVVLLEMNPALDNEAVISAVSKYLFDVLKTKASVRMEVIDDQNLDTTKDVVRLKRIETAVLDGIKSTTNLDSLDDLYKVRIAGAINEIAEILLEANPALDDEAVIDAVRTYTLRVLENKVKARSES